MSRNLPLYLVILFVFGAGTWLVLDRGPHFQRAADLAGTAAPPLASSSEGPVTAGLSFLGENMRHPLSLLLLQVLVIIVTARSLGALFHRLGQPIVIGEMVAGILLGPSLLGWLAPGSQDLLFPAESLAPLRMLSHIGVILFMFVVGVELDLGRLRERAHAAVLVSHTSIAVPFFLGVAGALFLFPIMAPAGASFVPFALFLGVSMSITAFPVLARIIEQRGMTGTSLGATAIACAAVDDVTAWCLLAMVVALVKSGGMGDALWTIGLSLLFVLLMLFVVRPRFARWAQRGISQGAESSGLLAALLIVILASALITEIIGIHALFGAFLAGVCMPPNPRLRQFLRRRLETFSSVFLLPLFFAFTGLRTQVNLLSDWRDWLFCLGVIVVAVVGKLGSCMAAARWTGMSWSDSFSLGALMNTRGLVELIVLNVGFDLGILSPRIFTMMVLMALITTFMTSPLLGLAERLQRQSTVGLRVSPESATGG